MTPEERHAYDEHINAIMIQNDVLSTARQEGLDEGRAEGLTIGRAEGRAEGQKEKALDVARNLKSMGLSDEMIAKATGLPEEDIRELHD